MTIVHQCAFTAWWNCVLEVARLRRDARSVLRIAKVVPRSQRAERCYVSRFFDDCVFNSDRIVYTRNGIRHCDDGPAAEETNGTRHWFVNDVRHCVDGAAIREGHGYCEWWVNNTYLRCSDGRTKVFYGTYVIQ